MNTHPASTPTFPGAPRRFGFNPFVFVLAGVALLASLIAFGLYARNSDDTASPVAPVEAPVPPSIAYFPDSVDRRSWTYYIVGSEEQAAALKAGLEESDKIRDAVGEPVLLESVYVASSAADAAAFTAAIVEGNLTLVALGFGEDRVVNLRAN